MWSRRQFLQTLSVSAAAQTRRRPNFVLILADDLGYGELGMQGNRQIPTPHIDSIAATGVRFTNGYVSAPFCCPSRAGLMTGRYQTRFGHERNVVGTRNLDSQIGLPHSEKTMADHLKGAGYATGLVGKWHLGATVPYHPVRRGFEEFYGFLHEGHFYLPPPYRGAVTRLRPNEPPYDDHNPLLRGENPVEEPAYLTKALGREAAAFIDRHASGPFFLYLAFNAIHSPMQAPVARMAEFESLAGEQRRLFAAMMREMDDAVGVVLNRLREKGLEQDTIVVFLSDNGGPTAELTSSNAPLRGGKGQLYEGGIRIPFAMRWPGVLAPGSVEERPAIALDLLPTFLAAAGVPTPAGLDGVDLRKIPAERPIYWRYGPNLALRRGAWKLVRQGGESFALYNLDQDPGEARDLAASEPDRVSSLRLDLETLNAQMRPPLW